MPPRRWLKRIAEARASRHAPVQDKGLRQQAIGRSPATVTHVIAAERPAPNARPARRKDDCAGRSPGSRVAALIPPSRVFTQWQSGTGLAADSCGGSFGLGPDTQYSGLHRIPFWPAETGTPTQVRQVKPAGLNLSTTRRGADQKNLRLRQKCPRSALPRAALHFA